MILGFISYKHGGHYHWICKNADEMKQYIQNIKEHTFSSLEVNDFSEECFLWADDGETWISTQPAEQYSIEQALLFAI